MSGFLGVFGGDPALHAPDVIEAAAARLAPRSPDGLSAARAGPATLVQGLLRLYPGDDTSPAVHSLGDRFWLAGDIRLDDRDQLRTRLRAVLGPTDHLESDADLVLQAYRAWSHRCTEHLLGDFSFVLWDAAAGEAFAAVDHFGVRPLYHARVGDGLVVSNTVQAMRSLPSVSSALDETSLADQLVFGLLMEPERTMFAAIQRLRAGHVVRWSGAAGIRIERYWQLAAQPEMRLGRSRDYVDAFRDVMSRSVHDRLRAAPAAVEMSGGLDSTLIAAVAQRTLADLGLSGGLQAWCSSHEGSFPDPEPQLAQLAARHIGIPLHLFDASRVAALDGADRPRPLPLPPLGGISEGIARECLAHSPLVLSGFDGDALLAASYRRAFSGRPLLSLARDGFALAGVAARNRRLPRLGLRSSLRRRPAAPPELTVPGWIDPDLARRVRLPDRLAYYANGAPSTDADPRASTRAALESPSWADLLENHDPGVSGLARIVVYPLMDLRVVSFLHALPIVPWTVEKHVMRRAGEGLLPSRIVRRRKTPLAGDPLESRRMEIVRATADLQHRKGDDGPYIRTSKLPRLDVAIGGDLLWSVARVVGISRWLSSGLSVPPV